MTLAPSLPSGARLPDDRLLGARTTSLTEHRAMYPAPPRPRRRGLDELIAGIERSGLLGRGGCAFPTGRKLRAVATHRGTPIVVVNASEGEPASAKDATLFQQAPHLVLDGAAWAAAAVGASNVVVAIERSDRATLAIVTRAIAARAHESELTYELAEIPPRYVAGEEHALVAWINGGEAKPTYGKVYESGVANRPTLVDNVETLAHLAQIACFGPEWFRRLGTETEPGTILCTVGGAVARPGVVEVPIGMPLGSVVRAAGGTTDEPQAVLMGGYYGAWLGRDQLADAVLSNAHLRPLGVSLGCGAVVVLGTSSCGLVETARVLAWLARESAGQCGPCVHGLASIADGMRMLALGHADRGTIDRLFRWGDQIEGRGACSFPDGAVRLLRSALRAFEADAHLHARGHVCAGGQRPPVLAVPRKTREIEWR